MLALSASPPVPVQRAARSSPKGADRGAVAVVQHALSLATRDWLAQWRASEAVPTESGASVARCLLLANRAWLARGVTDSTWVDAAATHLQRLGAGQAITVLATPAWRAPVRADDAQRHAVASLMRLAAIVERESVFTMGPHLLTWAEQVLRDTANPGRSTAQVWAQLRADQLAANLPLWAQIQSPALLTSARHLADIEAAVRQWARLGDRQALRPLLLSSDRQWRTVAMQALALDAEARPAAARANAPAPAASANETGPGLWAVGA